MPLRERHGAGVEPAVDNFRYAVHLFAAFFAFNRYSIDKRTVQFDIVRAIIGQGFQFFNGTDSVLMTAFTFPNVEWCTPVTVAGKTPVLHVFNPVAETAFADCRRYPVDCIIVGNQFVAYGRHADKPCFARVVKKRRIAAPAVRIAVFENRSGE